MQAEWAIKPFLRSLFDRAGSQMASRFNSGAGTAIKHQSFLALWPPCSRNPSPESLRCRLAGRRRGSARRRALLARIPSLSTHPCGQHHLARLGLLRLPRLQVTIETRRHIVPIDIGHLLPAWWKVRMPNCYLFLTGIRVHWVSQGTAVGLVAIEVGNLTAFAFTAV